jgi:hypothetical protein
MGRPNSCTTLCSSALLNNYLCIQDDPLRKFKVTGYVQKLFQAPEPRLVAYETKSSSIW